MMRQKIEQRSGGDKSKTWLMMFFVTEMMFLQKWSLWRR